MFSNLLTDIRYSLRGFAARPLFVVVAVLTLALGIGANTAIFSVLHGMFLRPLPYPDGERLVEIHNVYPNMGLDNAGTSIPDYLDRREQAASLEDAAMYTFASMNLADGSSRPERLVALRATPSLFTTLGVGAQLGREFTDEDAVPGADRVIVLSHALWANRYNADPGIVGRDLRANGESWRVLGVMPEGFGFPIDRVQAWTPFAFTPEQKSDNERGREYSVSIGRLKPGATVAGLDRELETIISRNADRLAGSGNAGAEGFAAFLRGGNFTARAQPLRNVQVGDSRPMVLLVQAAVALVLLIACANVANLMLTRLNTRQKELSVRSALGASRGQIARQVLVEVLLLALLGGGLGVALAYLSLDLLPLVGIETGFSDYTFRLDGQVLAFALVATLVSGLLAAAFPLFSLLRLNIHEVIKESGRLGSGGRRAAFSRGALVVAQVALATTLLIGAGLLLKSFQQLQAQSPGFASEGVMTAQIGLPSGRYGTPEARTGFYEAALDKLRAIPGVSSAGFVTELPFSGDNSQGSYNIDGMQVRSGQSSPHAMQRTVDEDYFEAMRIALLKGRAFTPADRADAPLVVVIDRLLADKYFRGRDPIGQRIRRGGASDDTPWATVVGVVATVKHERLSDADTKETLYWPYRQVPAGHGTFVLRTTTAPGALVGPMREAVQAVDPEQPLYDIKALNERIALSLNQQRAPMLLLGFFAAVALALSALGIYGVLAFTVGQRTGELGVRMALGAGAQQILRMILHQGARLTVIGLGLGLIGAYFAGRAVSAQLFGIGPADPLTYLGVIVFLGAVALLACWLPARRAARIDPLVALRYE